MAERAFVRGALLGLGAAIAVLKGVEAIENWVRWQTSGRTIPTYRDGSEASAASATNGGARVTYGPTWPD